MATIKPFSAITYNQEKIKDLSRVVCPPYDIITASQQQYYHQLNPYNFIHILLGKDIPGEDKYRRAATILKDWLKNKILIKDNQPAIYFYTQEYKFKGEKHLRLGFIANLSLKEANASIFGHEHTRLEPKADRLKLLKATKANLSPIFVVFRDKRKITPLIYQSYIMSNQPFIQVLDNEGVVHKLWRIESPPLLNRIQTALQDEEIFIADGHHRYEVACNYREMMLKRRKRITGEEGFNYIMAYFTPSSSRDLTILAVHRLVKLNPPINLDDLFLSLQEYFFIEEIKDKARFFFLMEKASANERLLGMYKNKHYWLLRLKNIKILDKIMPDKPKEYRILDLAILNSIIFKKILGLDPEDKDHIIFSQNIDELIGQADNDNLSLVFFLNPVKIEQIISLALKGQKMPAKSTYFYPKLLSGLVINKHG